MNVFDEIAQLLVCFREGRSIELQYDISCREVDIAGPKTLDDIGSIIGLQRHDRPDSEFRAEIADEMHRIYTEIKKEEACSHKVAKQQIIDLLSSFDELVCFDRGVVTEIDENTYTAKMFGGKLQGLMSDVSEKDRDKMIVGARIYYVLAYKDMNGARSRCSTIFVF